MKAAEHTLTSWDGAELFYRSWIPLSRPKKALLLFHRGHEHSGRWQQTVESLGLADVAVFAWDARGHGRSPGERGAARNLTDVVKDTDAFVRHVSEKYELPRENIIVLAHSLAAVTVAAWVHDHAPRIRAMILVTPAFQVKLYLPFAIPALRFRQRFFGAGRVTSYVKAGLLTRDRTEANRYDSDPLIFKQIAVNVLLDLHDTAKRLVADAGAIHTPTLMLSAGRDWIVRLNAQRTFFDRLSSPTKRARMFPAARHAMFHDLNREAVIQEIRSFVTGQFAETTSATSLLNADKSGYTRREFDRLSSDRGIPFAVARAGLRAAAGLSRGINIGWRSGFDSGLSLDYVYENRPRGRSPVGRVIDKSYLNSIGWRGIRERKRNLKIALTNGIWELRRQGRPIHILDIAAGAGRYVIEVMHELPELPINALLRDYEEENVTAARRLAGEFGLSNVSTVWGDAFDADSVSKITPKATIGLVSGLYELFPSNADVLKSLGGLAAAMESGGVLIYTNQPWHPQVEFIARVLHNRDGQPWVMRRRTTAEMDELVRTAGFTKMSMEIDQWGMFSVSMARRNNA
ncbi:MAG: bifunctional alpha/beta hydrolase/class I SAM-dependent methyltransferase [Chthoniobacterales bacterium]